MPRVLIVAVALTLAAAGCGGKKASKLKPLGNTVSVGLNQQAYFDGFAIEPLGYMRLVDDDGNVESLLVAVRIYNGTDRPLPMGGAAMGAWSEKLNFALARGPARADGWPVNRALERPGDIPPHGSEIAAWIISKSEIMQAQRIEWHCTVDFPGSRDIVTVTFTTPGIPQPATRPSAPRNSG